MIHTLETPDSEIPIRLHYLIRDGRLRLPGQDWLQVIRQKRKLQAILRFLGRSYIHLLCRGLPDEAARALSCYRGLQELDFHDLFGTFGFPDEPVEDPALADWLRQARESDPGRAGTHWPGETGGAGMPAAGGSANPGDHAGPA
jgi:hypothetical protein